MATRLLILLMLFVPLLAQGGEQCLNCHPRHPGGEGSCSSCHRGNPDATRAGVAHGGLVAGRHLRFTRSGDGAVAEGEKLVERFGCRRCHLIASRGNRLATNLDEAMASRGSASMVAALKRPAAAMPDFRLDDRSIDLLINRFYAAGAGERRGGEPPRRVHFQVEGTSRDPFSLRCGGCHRALTPLRGSLGRGDAGPDLSGLFTPFYPVGAPPPGRWTVARLADWVNNPRHLRPWSWMGPVTLSRREMTEIATILGDAGPERR